MIEDKKAKEGIMSAQQDDKSVLSPSAKAGKPSSSFDITSSVEYSSKNDAKSSTLSSTTSSSLSASLGHSAELNYLASLITPSTNSKKQQSIKLDFPEFSIFFFIFFDLIF